MAPKRKTYIKNCTGDDCGVERKKSHKLFLRVSFYGLSLVFICLMIYMLFFSIEMQINKVEIIGTRELDESEIKTLVEDHLKGKYLNLLSKNNYLLASGSIIHRELTDKYKKIRNVSVEKKFPDTIKINIDEHDSLMVWCKRESECYLLDEDGVAYNSADFNSPELMQNKLLQINDQSSADVTVGTKIMEQDYEQYLLNIKTELEKLNINIEDTFSTPSRMAEEIQVKSINGFNINFSTQFTLDSAMKTLSAVLKKEIPKEKIAELEYIDLRSEYKAFYKFKSIQEENHSDEEVK